MSNVQMLVSPDGDDWPLSKYQEAYKAVREGRSLSQVKEALGSQESKANWGRFETRNRINLAMKNDLRRYSGAPEIMASANDALAHYTTPNATVWFVGDAGEKADRVILIDPEASISIGDNAITIGSESTQMAEKDDVQGCTKPKRRRTDTERYKAFNERRKALGISWEEVHEAGLQFWEKQNS
jgi:hypothetical protein